MSSRNMLVAGPVLRRAALARLPLAAGHWLVAARLDPIPFADLSLLGDADIVCGVYLITGEDNRIWWLGQACRNDDLVQRLAAHHRNPARRAVFHTVRVLHLSDHTPPAALNAIEGRCADLLGLRDRMGPRRWPTSAAWPAALAASPVPGPVPFSESRSR